jgi:predicted O-linked N-acetylglucosamine transferase (SPINDLY family)
MAIPPQTRAATLAAARQALGLGQAEAALARLARLPPADAEVQFYRSAALRLLKQLPAAIEALQQARMLAPGHAVVAVNLGALLLQLGRPEEAVAHLEAAVAIAPQAAPGWSNLAGARLLLGQAEGAAEAAARALALNPKDSAAAQTLAQVRVLQGRRQEALEAAALVTRLAPESADAWRVLGEAWRAQKDSEQAAEAYRRAHALAPDNAQTAGILLLLLQQLCQWEAAAAVAARLDALPLGPDAPAAEPMLAAVSRSFDGAWQLAVARAWGREIARNAGPPLPPLAAQPRDRLTVGYLSGDLRDHAVGHLAAGLFQAHDRRAVAVKLFTWGGPEESAVKRRIEAGAEAVIDIGPLGHRAAAERVRAEGVDILVELGGHTRGSRLEIPALRPAPLQVSYLGFPGTTGVAGIDYLVGDPVVTPPDEQAHYAERLLILPRPYQANARRPSEPPTAETRDAHGLPEAALVLSSMNASYKLEPVFWALWLRLLHALPEALLWLYAPAETARRGLLQRAMDAGVDPARLIFAGRAPHAQHLGRLALADLALDTRIYGGHTTTTDCLRMGVPVVAMRGRHFASRVSQSLLLGVGLAELIAEDEAGYEALVLALARDPARRVALRERILAERETGRLFDEQDLARCLERAYRAIWQRAVAGEAPATLVMD